MKKLVEKKVWVKVMQDNDKRYELTIESSINILKVYTIISMFLTFGVLALNIFLKLNKIWNICFLIPMYLIYIGIKKQIFHTLFSFKNIFSKYCSASYSILACWQKHRKYRESV